MKLHIEDNVTFHIQQIWPRNIDIIRNFWVRMKAFLNKAYYLAPKFSNHYNAQLLVTARFEKLSAHARLLVKSN